MGIAEKYYTDTALVQICKGISDRGDTELESEIPVPCRFDDEQKETLDSKGQTVLSYGIMLCTSFIPPLSIVKNEWNECFTVKSCSPVKNISGVIDHYEVIL